MAEQIIKRNALPINPDLLMNSIGNSRIVMIGDNTHGTSDFYYFRSEMSKKLITEKGFTVIGIEWDWVDVNKLNQYILGNTRGPLNINDLTDRFPEFMYENHPFEEFIEWLKAYNQTTSNKVTIYGLDIFGITDTLKLLYNNLPNQRNLIQRIMNIWQNFNSNEYNYGNSGQSIENEVNQLQLTGNFFIDQTILQLQEAERYYRIKNQNESQGWNLRDQHMARVITDLLNYTGSKMICWLHNTHSGNASFVQEFKNIGETSAAAILKQSYGSQVYSIGLLTYSGTVTASDHWYGPTIKFNLNPGIEGSFEDLFHESIGGDFMLILRNSDPQLLQLLSIPEYERFIGGAYSPQNEIRDHYVHAQIYPQFDALVFFDQSQSFDL